MTAFPSSLATVGTLGGAVNGIATTLNGALNNSDTTINVVDTTGFPTAGYAVIETEIITYTGKTSSTLTGVTRGVDGSAAASHSSGSAVSCFIVAAHVTNLQNEVVAIETLLGTSSQDVDLSGRAGHGIKLKSSGGNSFIVTVDDSGNLTVTSA